MLCPSPPPTAISSTLWLEYKPLVAMHTRLIVNIYDRLTNPLDEI